MAVTESPYPRLFSSITLGGSTLRNRITHASITTRYGKDRRASERLIQYHANRARGGAAMTITEPLASVEWQKQDYKVQIYNDLDVDGLARFAEQVETEGCRLIGQLQDSGRGRREGGRKAFAFAPSVLPDDLSWTVPRAMTVDEIRLMIEQMADSAGRLQRAGWSGVELSAGHGHLFHQFLSPWSNRREDAYGGDLAGRTRLIAELVEAIRAVCGRNFIVGLKLPGDDGIPDSIGPDEACRIADVLADPERVDFLAVTQGSHSRSLEMHIPDMHWPRIPFRALIERFRGHANGIPVMALGLITDPAEAEGLIEQGIADLVGLGRPLITDTNWPAKAAAGRQSDIRYCVSCNTCWTTLVAGNPIRCDNNPRLGDSDEADWQPKPAGRQKRVVVAGAGIAGLEAAWLACARGHTVTVFCASADVGGKTRLHALLPGGENLSSIYDYQFAKAREAGVRFEIGLRAKAEDVLVLKPDAVVLATGSTMRWPDGWPAEWRDYVPDARRCAADLLDHHGREDGTAVLYDADGTFGTYAAAEQFARQFSRVVVVTVRDRIADDCGLVTRQGVYRRFHEQGIEIVTFCDIDPHSRLADGEVNLRNVYTRKTTRVSDLAMLTFSTSRVPDDTLAAELESGADELYLIGDAFIPRDVLAATADGNRVGQSV